MKKNGRDLWLQQNAVSAAAFIEVFSQIEQQRTLMPRESDMKELARAYAYLFASLRQKEVVDNSLEDVTVH